MNKLDAIDIAILKTLQEDGRISNANLADRVGLTHLPIDGFGELSAAISHRRERFFLFGPRRPKRAHFELVLKERRQVFDIYTYA